MKQVAVGIIMSNGRVLACQRKRGGSYPLKWEFPGGKLENGESGVNAVVREIHEELGIDVIVDREFYRQEWVYPQSNSGNEDGAFRVFYFLINNFMGTPVNHAFEQIRWVTPKELKDMDILDGNRDAVEILVAHARENQISEKE